MRKIMLFLALGMFLSVSVNANACDKDKASLKASKGKTTCMKASAAKSCTVKNGVDCTKDPNCAASGCTSKAVCATKHCSVSQNSSKAMNTSKTSKNSISTAEKY